MCVCVLEINNFERKFNITNTDTHSVHVSKTSRIEYIFMTESMKL